VSPVQGEAN